MAKRSSETEDRGGDIRTPRGSDSREANIRDDDWTAPSHLPIPTAIPGIRHRWIRVATLGESDNRNLSKRFREGWAPVRVEDDPVLAHEVSDEGSKWGKKGALEVGGLLLCKIDERLMIQRAAHYAATSDAQMKAVDAQLMSNSDSRMPIIAPNRQSRTTAFGNSE